MSGHLQLDDPLWQQRQAIADNLEGIRHGHGDHADHHQRFEAPHWIVCSCGGRAVATSTQVKRHRDQ